MENILMNNLYGPESGSLRVIRGGGWYNLAVSLRSAYRSSYSPSSRNYDLGFRLVRTSRNTKRAEALRQIRVIRRKLTQLEELLK